MKTLFTTGAALGLLLAAAVEGRAHTAPTDPILKPKPRPPVLCALLDGQIVCVARGQA